MTDIVSGNTIPGVAYDLGVRDRRNNKYVRNLRAFSTNAQKEYARGWIDEWLNETTKTINTTKTLVPLVGSTIHESK